jgi:hypothetical protein
VVSAVIGILRPLPTFSKGRRRARTKQLEGSFERRGDVNDGDCDRGVRGSIGINTLGENAHRMFDDGPPKRSRTS